ncbi:MAG: hypothetical protein JXA54_05900 [Candidatus Heimdallarchaeota archaeon]|nr:hypothetical protein [Candidatus Heimdallarchaeota archaeon]
MSEVDKVSEKELDTETERMIYRITEGLQRLNSIGTVQFIQIDLPPLPDALKEELTKYFDSALEDGLYVNQTIVLEQMDTGDSFMRLLNAIRKLYHVSKLLTVEEIQAVVNIDYKGETMDIIVTYDPEEHDISLVSVTQKEDFFKILEYVRFFWMKSRPRV